MLIKDLIDSPVPGGSFTVDHGNRAIFSTEFGKLKIVYFCADFGKQELLTATKNMYSFIIYTSGNTYFYILGGKHCLGVLIYESAFYGDTNKKFLAKTYTSLVTRLLYS